MSLPAKRKQEHGPTAEHPPRARTRQGRSDEPQPPPAPVPPPAPEPPPDGILSEMELEALGALVAVTDLGWQAAMEDIAQRFPRAAACLDSELEALRMLRYLAHLGHDMAELEERLRPQFPFASRMWRLKAWQADAAPAAAPGQQPAQE